MKFTSALKLKLIYVFRINDKEHLGCLKIGEATSDNENIWGLEPNSKALNEAAKKRITQYTQTAGITYDLLYTEITLFIQNKTIHAFSDNEVHNVLIRSGIKQKTFDTQHKANEWFVTDLETVKHAIKAVKEGKDSLGAHQISTDKTPIAFRPEQKDAIDKTKKQFKKSNQMLWNAKMRFGKTLSALQVVKDMNFTRTLILTHRPVVDAGWFEDFGKIFTEPDTPFKYGSKTKGDNFSTLEKQSKQSGVKYVYFASMQDLRGSELVGGNFDKNNELFASAWDFIIVDEAHEGTKTELGEHVMSGLMKTDTKVLRLSGTPFNLFDDFKEDEIYTWDYVMEQRAKKDWDDIHLGDPNPYASLPRMRIYTYDLGKLMKQFVDEDVAFNFREFFRVNKEGTFLHENDVRSFLNLICKTDDHSNYPYATQEYCDNFRHSLWMVPGVKEARALSAHLQAHPVFSQFQIVNVAGDGDEEEANQEALKKVENAIGTNPHETYTITLSCGRLTTGVSVKAWTAVFMLSGSFNTSASGYMQTIFRVQTPATINGRVKEQCFVFDFAPDRTLKVIAETAKISAKAGKTTGQDRDIMGEFLNFCPIISVDGSRMSAYNVDKMLEQLKKVYIERVVRNGFDDNNLYNDQLLKLDNVELQEFDGLKKIIGTTKAMHKSGDIELNKQGFSNEEYEQQDKEKSKKQVLTDEQKKILEERKKNKETAISILRGISIRMPLLIYGADVNDENEEITIDNFAQLIDPQSWEEFMPKGVSKQLFNSFKKYYEPDVFRAAGKRIRAMAKAADKLTIEERIARITAIFNTFRNPDKETVLTPWRVVNMHVGDCMGGFVFFDEAMENPQEQPQYVEQGEVTRNVFNADSLILEINSKSGLYPLYMAYGIYRTRLAADDPMGLNPTPTLEQQLALWDKTLSENIFVICKTKMAKYITRRTLVGFRNEAKVNTRYFEDLINQIINKPTNFIEKVKLGKTYWKANNNDNMKFNAIVGNPPYQVMDGGGTGSSAVPVYDKFVDIAKKVNPEFLSMIMPSKWYSGGRGLDQFRESMLGDKRMHKLFDYDDSRDCFQGVDIAGGICYFLWNYNYDGSCNVVNIRKNNKTTTKRHLNEFDSFIRDGEAIHIINKVKELGENNFSTIVFSSKPFGLRSYVVGDKEASKDSITLYGSQGISYVKLEDITVNRELIGKWKVIMSKTSAEHAGQSDKDGKKKVVSRIEVLEPNVICTESYLLLSVFDNESDALNLKSYVQSRFFRFLLSTILLTQNIAKDKFQFIPLQDLTSSSDIDWSQSVTDIDRQLYAKYGLSEEEVAFIEGMIKGM
ncbi:MAG: DEAD/DEAH box helicase [Porphyromonadaceae bacterium CG2_30_38_12]|nr:MAG: DEAD/DEAH box helicase [Porphyromonadaceae bacterium CG2_30_38_12]